MAIQNADVPIVEQAEMAFQQLADFYNLPKLPEDIIYDDTNEDNSIEKVSVYEALGLIKYLNAGEDPRGLVLFAVYCAKYGHNIDLQEVFKKKYGNEIPTNIGVGFRGENSNVEIIFIDQNQSWFDLGCKLFLKNS
ncbi:hypothetical protein [Pedobacter sp. Hv1]|uniref:hypothetical protein n=1 Tax=Pedobacter sp. Hv1 TaxID=1740090 RepID=UPI00128F7546|nr:hypothetical protein [Pedobacter sp. Hv1]